MTIENTPQTQHQFTSNTVPGLFALERFTKSMGVTRETMFKWRREGMLDTVNIYGRLYVTVEEAARFKQRAMAGEFARAVQTPAKK